MELLTQEKILNKGVDKEIEKLNFERIKYKLSLKKDNDGQEWSKEKIKIAEKEYKRYLTLIKIHYPKSIVPSKIMDEFWHMHILDTKAYREDCKKVFGRFIDHFPYFGIYGNEDKTNLEKSFEETKKLYQKRFKENPFDINASRCEDHPCHAPSECKCRASGTCK